MYLIQVKLKDDTVEFLKINCYKHKMRIFHP
jgi:hypothetical protein